MIPRLVLSVTLIAAITGYVILARHVRHKELIAQIIAFGATRRALEQSAFAAPQTERVAATRITSGRTTERPSRSPS
ncbi:hypothetical protein IWX78_002954 [Mycetocola sp. CAN_C7]|uniref:hypothetical protein n=1 Tax=Mycetocola sp. CAN_C7 TaxID=2787724 RepID=UPI0018C97E94